MCVCVLFFIRFCCLKKKKWGEGVGIEREFLSVVV